MDFSTEQLRDTINNEMVIHDNFNVKSLDDHRTELALPANSSEVEVKIAYLKREMTRLVERLTHPSYKDLTHVQMNTLRGQARQVLANIRAANIPHELKQSVLLTLALRTGAHCNRVYLDTFAELFLRCGYSDIQLTLKERAILCAQEAREACFKTYYYGMQDTWRAMLAGMPQLRALTTDINDFNAYELFALNFGRYLYLPNQKLQSTERQPMDMVADYLVKSQMKDLSELGHTLFSDDYTPVFLINQALDARGKLHLIFQEWCNSTFYNNAYNDLFFDEDQFPVNRNSRQETLAALMLLDLGLIELTQPIATPVMHTPSTYESLWSYWGHTKKPATLNQQPNANRATLFAPIHDSTPTSEPLNQPTHHLKL